MYYDSRDEFEQSNDGINESNNTEQKTNQANDNEVNQNNANNNYSSPNGGFYNGAQNNPNNHNKKNNRVLIIALIVATIFVIGSFATTAVYVINNMSDSSIEDVISGNTDEKDTEYQDIGSTQTTEDTNDNTSSGVTVTDVSGVVDSTMPSVVAITTTTVKENYNSYEDIWEYYFGGGNGGNGGGTYEEQASGSGIIIDQTDSELLIVTNNHVVEGSDSLEIQFFGQTDNQTVKGYIKGTDANVDVAVVAVKLEDIPSDIMKNIKKATLGDSDTVKVGEGVVAIGNALGFGQSVTSGVVSAKDREVSLESKTMKLIQTDAAINGGNSGGALINAKGEVIGINVAKYSSNAYSGQTSIEGMGFAIPISSVKDIINNLEKQETKTKYSDEERGYLGITGYKVTESISEQYGLPIGISVTEVKKDGPADKAGIQKYDVITKLDGQQVASVEDLNNKLQYYKSGEKVTITISYKEGNEVKEEDVTVTLGNKDSITGLSDKYD